MPLRDLRGKTVHDLELEDFDKLFCQHCQQRSGCDQCQKTLDACQILLDSGLWDRLYRKRKE